MRASVSAAVHRSAGGVTARHPIEAGPAVATRAGVRIEGVGPWMSPEPAREVLASALSVWAHEGDASALEIARGWSSAMHGTPAESAYDAALEWDACASAASAAQWLEHREARGVAGTGEEEQRGRDALWRGDSAEAARAMHAAGRRYTREWKAGAQRWREAVLGRRAHARSEEGQEVQRRMDACLLEGAGGALEAAHRALAGETAGGPGERSASAQALATSVERYGEALEGEERRALGAQAREYAVWADADIAPVRTPDEEEALIEEASDAMRRVATHWVIGADGALREAGTESTLAQWLANDIAQTGDARAPYGVGIETWALIARATGPSSTVTDLPEGTLLGAVRREIANRVAGNSAREAARADAEETLWLGNRLAGMGVEGWEPFVNDARRRREALRAGGGPLARPGPEAARTLESMAGADAHDPATRAARRTIAVVHAQHRRTYDRTHGGARTRERER